MTTVRPIRTMIVDDSAVARQLLHWMLTRAGDFEVIETVGDGERAVERVAAARPDLVTMDVHLPGIDGLEATRRIMRRSPTPIAIVAASANIHDGIIFEALEAGALTVVQRPLAQGQPSYLRRRRVLLGELRAIAPARIARGAPSATATASTSRGPRVEPARRHPSPYAGQSQSVELIAIAASTGGPQALKVFLSGLTDSRPAGRPKLPLPPIVVVQHIAEGFVEGLASWLNADASGPVRVAVNGERLERGTILLAPDGRHLTVTPDGRVRLLSTPAVGGHRPSADTLFASVAAAYGSRAAGIVLTGMGRDGAEGLRELHATGAPTFAQDPATAVVGGMPAAAVDLGAVGQVLSLAALASVVERLAAPSSARSAAPGTRRGPVA